MKCSNTFSMPGKVGARRDLRDKTVVIAGAAGGIGSAFAHRFGQAGIVRLESWRS